MPRNTGRMGEGDNELEQVEDDPGKPWKAVGAAGASLCAALLGLGLDFPDWLTTVLVFGASAGGAYTFKNPKRRRGNRSPR